MLTQPKHTASPSQHALPPCTPRLAFGVQRPRKAGSSVARTETIAMVATRDKPAWTGDSFLSRVVNWAINTKPLYAAMVVLAKQAMKNSADSRGVGWDRQVKMLQEATELKAIKAEFEKSGLMPYPDYYLQPFHAYPKGNLEWQAAYEVLPATYAMGIRTFKDQPDWTAEHCFVELRTRITDAIKGYHARHGLPLPSTIVDMGCSTGLSTTWLANQFPDAASVTGLDLSTHFLAVAEWDRRRGRRQPWRQQQPQDANQPPSAPVNYLYGLAERSPFPDASKDLVTFNFVIHECPQAAITDFVTEGLRVVRPGGVLVFVDNNPRSSTIQNLPAPIFTLMKSTEPWSDEYYSYDLEASMRAAGFREVVTVESDHRHRCVMGIRP